MVIDCALLAGGSSRRMGEPKLLLNLGGRTLFEHVLAVHLASRVRRVCAVVPGWLDGFGEIVRMRTSGRAHFAVLDRECEMSESLKTGWRRIMQAGKPDAVMISLADMPFVTPGVIDSVLDCFAGSDCEICVPVYGGRRGHPVVLSVDLEEEVLGLEGDCGARAVVRGAGRRVAEVQVDTDGVLVDIDTCEDFEEARRRMDQVG
ncbi:MAG: nucleotidyltransferase family protein [bacterium]|jgi:molybdenum cofactor cytidylyltransferase